MDIVLSSGFLAFAEHAGFLAAVAEAGVPVDGVCGTSSGAIAGVGLAAGLSAEEIFDELCGRPPYTFMRGSTRPWRGLFTMRAVIERLRGLVPATFEGLGMPLGVGLMDRAGRPRLATSGPLPEAIAASMAIPLLFARVDVGGERMADGGAVDRTALGAWRDRRPGADVLLHLVESSRPSRSGARAGGLPADGATAGAAELAGVRIVRSPASRASFLSLGDARRRFERSRRAALDVLGN